jgi:hypothetical protein
VVAVACDTRVPAGAGRTIRADRLAATVPARGWHRMSGGPRERLYDWAIAGAGAGRRLLIRTPGSRSPRQPAGRRQGQ